MPQINQLPTRTPVAGDTVPFYSSNNGDAAKTSFTAISTLVSSLMGVSGGGGFITQYSSPTADAFTITVGGTGQSTWLIITPTVANLTGGEIVLPVSSTLADQQELLVVTTNAIAFTIDGNGATVFGAPVSLDAGSCFSLKYDSVMNRWYCSSNSSSTTSEAFINGGGGEVTVAVASTYYPLATNSSVSSVIGNSITAEESGAGSAKRNWFAGLNPSKWYELSLTATVSASAATKLSISLATHDSYDNGIGPFDVDLPITTLDTVSARFYVSGIETAEAWVTCDDICTLSNVSSIFTVREVGSV